MFIDPTGVSYTIEYLRWRADLVSRIFRACHRKRRGRKILFAAVVVTIYAAVGVFTNYMASHATRMSRCSTQHCTATEFAANQQFLDGFDWTVFYTMTFFATALICILALLLRLHEDLTWNIPMRKLMMQCAPNHPLDKLESQIKRFLNVSVWVLLVLGTVFVFVLYEYARNTA